MNSGLKTTFILLMGGNSLRMGSSIKKELVGLVGQKTALDLLLETAINEPAIMAIQVVVSAEHLELAAKIVANHKGAISLCVGGATRQESVFKGLLAQEHLNPDYVLIHDGARPWLSSALLAGTLEATHRYQAAIPVEEITQALKRVNGLSHQVLEHCDREQFVLAQTPQGFAFAPLLRAHHQHHGVACHDDAQLWALSYPHIPVQCITGERINKKITYYEDLP